MSYNPALSSTGALTLLYSNTLSSAGDWDVSSISQAYDELLIHASTRTTGGGNNVQLKPNNSGTTAASNLIAGVGTGNPSTTAFTDNQIGYTAYNSSQANGFGTIKIRMPEYASTTKNKAAFSDFTASYGSSLSLVGVSSWDWHVTDAINRLRLWPGGSETYVSGSSIQIYGVKY